MPVYGLAGGYLLFRMHHRLSLVIARLLGSSGDLKVPSHGPPTRHGSLLWPVDDFCFERTCAEGMGLPAGEYSILEVV